MTNGKGHCSDKIPSVMIFTLIGFMGCGKSSVGKCLAARLGWDFADSDALIQEGEKTSIPEIFASRGESGFREIEYRYISEEIGRYGPGSGHLLFSLGGGAPVYGPIYRLISERTFAIYLKCPEEELIDNLIIDGIGNRPMLSGGDLPSKVRSLLSEREPVYSCCARLTVHPYSLTPEMLLAELRRTAL